MHKTERTIIKQNAHYRCSVTYVTTGEGVSTTTSVGFSGSSTWRVAVASSEGGASTGDVSVASASFGGRGVVSASFGEGRGIVASFGGRGVVASFGFTRTMSTLSCTPWKSISASKVRIFLFLAARNVPTSASKMLAHLSSLNSVPNFTCDHFPISSESKPRQPNPHSKRWWSWRPRAQCSECKPNAQRK